jgi:hypothetical protein
MFRKFITVICLCWLAGSTLALFANPNFQFWGDKSGGYLEFWNDENGTYSDYREWPDPNDLEGHGFKAAWRGSGLRFVDVYEDAVTQALHDIKRLVLAPATARPLCPTLCGGIPAWVKSGATVDLDFANGRAFGCTLSSCLSITRASSKTNLLPSSISGFAYTTFGNNVLAITPGSGLLIEEARTNQLLNSAVPATQTTGSLGTGTYTLWVNGSGSATMSLGTGVGCGTGSATNGTPVNFTITVAGTCIVTVIGSLNLEQLELGAFGTSGIVTAGATATRAADSISFAGASKTILQSPPSSVVVQTNPLLTSAVNARIFSFNGNVAPLIVATNTTVDGFNGSIVIGPIAIGNSGSFTGGLVKSGAAWTTLAAAIVANNGTVSTSANGFPAAQPNFFFGSQGGSSNFASGYFSRVSIWNTQLSNSALGSNTQ